MILGILLFVRSLVNLWLCLEEVTQRAIVPVKDKLTWKWSLQGVKSKKREGIVAICWNYFLLVWTSLWQNSAHGQGTASPPCLKKRKSWHLVSRQTIPPLLAVNFQRSNSRVSGSNCTHNNSKLAATVKKGKFTPLQLNILFWTVF